MTPRFVNVGSGQRPFASPWTNCDSQSRWNPDVLADGAEYLQSRPADSVEMICLHHCLEHHTIGAAAVLIGASQRALKPGGSLLIFVPDLEALTHAWIEGRIDDFTFCVNLHGAYMGDEADIHKWSWAEWSLSKFLRAERLPWKSIRRFDWRKIEGADMAGPDWWILGMEAIK
jgi:SAM-dependent methyltransferase